LPFPAREFVDELVNVGLGLDVDTDGRLVDDENVDVGRQPLASDTFPTRCSRFEARISSRAANGTARAISSLRVSRPSVRAIASQTVMATLLRMGWSRITPSYFRSSLT
jgi:hypothetical protein